MFRLLGTSRNILLQSLQLRYRWPISALIGGVVHAVPLSSGIGKLVRARHGNGRSFGTLNRLQHASFLALLAVGLLVPKKKQESHSKKNPRSINKPNSFELLRKVVASIDAVLVSKLNKLYIVLGYGKLAR